MKTTCLFLLIFAAHAQAQNPELRISDTTNSLKLRRYLDAREQLFYQYSYQIQNKTGIFGNQTTKDLRASNEILLGIITADNKIINQLDAVISEQRYSDRTNQNDEIQAAQRIVDYGKLTDKLKAENDQLKSTMQKTIDDQTLYLYFALAAAVVFGVLWLLKLRWINELFG